MTLPAGGKRMGAVFMSIGALGTRPRVTCVTALRTQTGGGGGRFIQGERSEEEEGLFKANAVNEEDPECDRATPA